MALPIIAAALKAAPLLAKKIAGSGLMKSLGGKMTGGKAGFLQAAPAVGGLLFGENNIFSGKGRQASREGEKAFQASQNMGIGQGYYDVLNSMQSRANRGLGASTLGLMERTAGRNTAAGIGALKGKRQLLAGLGSITQAGQDAAMNIGAANEQALSSNRRDFDQTRLQVAGLEQENMLRKNQEAKDYWANRKAESNQAISSNLAAVGSAIGTGLSMGAMNKQTNALNNLGDLFNSSGNATTQSAGAAPGLFQMPAFNRLQPFSANRMLGGQFSKTASQGLNLLRTPKLRG